ncbi:MAG TPA: SDR family NAD(P)-dependent oxidoreductase [Acidimicrobiales bacterium]|nr:SDR family NAD(P)-dependent oxidoreductase [Acidimicrobiales bacterium]
MGDAAMTGAETTAARPRVALVTGAGGGLGPTTVSRLAADGFTVVAVDLSEQALKPLADHPSGRVATARVDVTSPADVDAAVASAVADHGGLDVVVNMAGVIRNAMLAKITDDDFGLVMATHVNGTLNTMRAASPVMRDQQYGRIVNLSSIAVRGSLAGGSYGAAKGAIEGLSRAAAIDLARHGITVNCVAPGVIASGMFLTTPQDYQDDVLRRAPMGRAGTPDEVASCIAFLAGADASYVTGQTLFVCGGLSIGF